MKLNNFFNYGVYIPDPPSCKNKWCNNPDLNIPTTGMREQASKCSNIQTLINERSQTGGLSGRGVTVCPFGFIEKTNWKNEQVYIPYTSSEKLVKTSTLFDPNRPGYLPPQTDPRPLIRIGNTYRN